MDRFSHLDAARLNYQEALEFIGKVRAGISWERFRIAAVQHFDTFISLLGDTAESGQFLSVKGISREYVHDQVGEIMHRILFNHENDHYLALGLSHHAAEKEIHKRWKDLMLIYHPDRSNAEESALCATRVNEAYNVLKNRELRAEYDRNFLRKSYLFPAGNVRNRYGGFRSQSPPLEPTGMSRVLPRIVIPSLVAVASLVLLILFLENRQTAFQPDELSKTVPGKIQNPQTPIKEIVGVEERQVVQTIIPHEDKAIKTKVPALSQPAKSEKRQIGIVTTQLNSPLTGDPDKKEGQEGLSNPIALPQSVAENSNEGIPGIEKTSPAKAIISDAIANPRPPESPMDKETADWEEDIYLFLLQYASAYEKGDINAFMALLSRNIIENNSMRYEDIRKFYGTNFETGKYRYTLRDVKIDRGREGVIVVGMYRIEKLSGSDKGVTTKGRISWTLRKEDGTLRIVRSDYDRR